MAFSTGSSRATINVTPLIDVLLVLLIIFMVLVPTLPRGVASALPQAPSGHPQTPPEPPLIVDLTGSDSAPVRFHAGSLQGELAQLAPSLISLLAHRSDRTVFLRGERSLEFASVAQAVSAVHTAGATQVGILTAAVQTNP